MGFLNIATASSLATAIARSQSNSDMMIFPTDQPHAFVHGGGVIGETYTIALTQDIPTKYNTSLIYVSQNLRFDGTPMEGVVYNVIISNEAFQEEFEMEIDPAGIGFSPSKVYVNGSFLPSGHFDYIYIPASGFLWVRALYINNMLFIMTK